MGFHSLRHTPTLPCSDESKNPILLRWRTTKLRISSTVKVLGSSKSSAFGLPALLGNRADGESALGLHPAENARDAITADVIPPAKMRSGEVLNRRRRTLLQILKSTTSALACWKRTRQGKRSIGNQGTATKTQTDKRQTIRGQEQTRGLAHSLTVSAKN